MVLPRFELFVFGAGLLVSDVVEDGGGGTTPPADDVFEGGGFFLKVGGGRVPLGFPLSFGDEDDFFG